MIDMTGIPQLVKNFSRFRGLALKAIVTAAEMSQARVVNDARNDHPYKDRTQNLTNSIQPGAVEVTDDTVIAYVEARMQYASFVEFGTSRARAYPFLTPALLRNSNGFRKNLARQLDAISL